MYYGYPGYGYGYGYGCGWLWVLVVVLIIFFVLFWNNGPCNNCHNHC